MSLDTADIAVPLWEENGAGLHQLPANSTSPSVDSDQSATQWSGKNKEV